jgi:hypothetical protein
VLLSAAGTIVAVVVAEWPGATGSAGESSSSTAAASQPNVSIGAGGLGSMDDPSVRTPPWAKIVAAGSAEEARRDARARAEADGPPPSQLTPHVEPQVVGSRPQLDFAEREAWWSTTPTGQMVDEIMSYDPARTATTLRLGPIVDVTMGRTRYNVGDGPSVGTVEFSDGSRPRGESEVYDFSVRLDAMGGADKRPIDWGVIGGLRAANLFDPSLGDQSLREPVPVMGGDARWKWSERSMLRASALSEAPGSDRDYLDLRLEQVWRVGGGSSLSLGWRHLHGIMSNEQPEPTLKQDAILLELKIGF